MLMQEIYEELKKVRKLYMDKVDEIGARAVLDSDDCDIAYIRGKMNALEFAQRVAINSIDKMRHQVADIFWDNRDYDL